MTWDDQQFLFWPICKSSKGERLRESSCRVFDKNFSLDQIGSGQTTVWVSHCIFNRSNHVYNSNFIVFSSANIQHCMNNISPSHFTVVPMWPKSYHTTGPKSTFLRHLVRHRILSKTLSGCISYSCLRNLFKRKLEALGEKSREYGLHSFRVGGATAAANLGVADSLFKCYGRWWSENAKDGYVEDNTEQQLGVSRNLGL